MSELINEREANRDFRWQLLNTVSALAVLAMSYSDASAIASEDNKPTVWIELGGQLEGLSKGQEQFAPPFVLRAPRPPAEAVSPLAFEHAPRTSKGGQVNVVITPPGSEWSVSAGIRYGRSNNNKHVHQQSYPAPFTDVFPTGYTLPIHPLAAKFSDVVARNSEQHVVLDFQVGKDVGLGMFGKSAINLGVRFAQFISKSNITLRSNPDWHFNYYYYSSAGVLHKAAYGQPYHSYFGRFVASRSFHGVGPSLSWKASTPIVGQTDSGQVSFDWGVNAAVLFGRQKAQTHHQTTAQYHAPSGFTLTQPVERVTLYQNAPLDQNRSRSLAVPNVGGFAGLSFSFPNAKVSVGYRADFFFGAMDGGIDARKSETLGFNGPYASMSIGLGG